MISSLKSWQLRKAIINHPNYKKRINTSSANNGSNILLLASVQYAKEVKSFVEKLKITGRSIRTIYSSTAEVESTTGNIITPKTTTWYGVPEGKQIDKILSREYDMLIYLKPNVSLSDIYCLEIAKSRFNIGPYLSKTSKYFDLIIDKKDKEDINELIDIIMRQLSVLSKRYEQ